MFAKSAVLVKKSNLLRCAVAMAHPDVDEMGEELRQGISWLFKNYLLRTFLEPQSTCPQGLMADVGPIHGFDRVLCRGRHDGRNLRAVAVESILQEYSQTYQLWTLCSLQ